MRCCVSLGLGLTAGVQGKSEMQGLVGGGLAMAAMEDLLRNIAVALVQVAEMSTMLQR